jgi:hypothetical protein
MIRTASLLVLLLSLTGACDGGGPAASVGLPPEGAVDSTPPLDSLPTDTVPPPPDSVGQPPDSASYTPVHAGIPFGPTQQGLADFGPDYSGTLIPGIPDSVMLMLEAARRANLRLFIQFSGSEQYNRDEHGFSMEKWKARVDRFRGMDFSSYIQDGTLIGHRIMDEPNDANNWSGKEVTLPEIEEMARYSKEIWPTLPAVIRALPEYLKGYQFQYLDAAWAQYIHRFGSVEEFIATNIRDAKEAGIGLIAGMNLINGGSGSSGIPGRKGFRQLWSMGADEIRTYGNAILADPYLCAFLMFEYEAQYLARPDIKAALAELAQKAAALPKKECRRQQ